MHSLELYISNNPFCDDACTMDQEVLILFRKIQIADWMSLYIVLFMYLVSPGNNYFFFDNRTFLSKMEIQKKISLSKQEWSGIL